MSRRGSGGVGAVRGAGGEGQPASRALSCEFELVLIDGDNLLHRVRGMRDEAGLRWLLPRLRAWLPPGTRALVMLDGHPDPGDSYHRHVATGVDFQHSGNNTADTALVGTLSARPFADRARTVVVSDDRALGDRVRRAGGLVRRLDWLVGGLAAAVGEVPPAVGSELRGPGSRRSVVRGSGSCGSSPRGSWLASGSPAESDKGIFTAGIRPVGIGGGSRSRPGINRGPRPGARTTAARPEPRDARGTNGGAPDSSSSEADPFDASQEREPWKPGRGATRKHGNPKREPRRGGTP